MNADKLREIFAEQSLTFLADTPYVYHCHHYNLFHDQTIDDALGEELGTEVRTLAAYRAARPLLDNVLATTGAETTVERVQVASELFAWMGQGKLALTLDEHRSSAASQSLHYGRSWLEKYGKRVRREFSSDAVAAGFAMAAMEAAFRLPTGSVRGRETACVAMRDPECRFELERGSDTTPLPALVDQAAVRRHVSTPFGGLDEDRITAIGKGLVDFMKAVQGDEQGLIQAFNVFVAAHLSSYYNETVYETMHRVERTTPAATSAVEALMCEAGQVCVYNTFGNILISPEWEGLVGKLSGDPADIISFGTAIARGLGFGHWVVGDYEVGKRFVLRCSSNYEAPFYRERYGKADKPRGYFMKGAARAMMVLAERVAWNDDVRITNEAYIDLFRGKVPYRAEQTQCMAMGAEISEFIVTKTG